MPVIAVGDIDKICMLEATERESFTSKHKGTACVCHAAVMVWLLFLLCCKVHHQL
jgi:hypothetical protein